MTKPTEGEQKSTDKANAVIPLSEAVRIVRGAVSVKEDRLKEMIADDEETDSVLLVGETTAGYIVHVMANHPAEVAQIMLDYHYPIYTVLEKNAPQEMWDKLARMVGLDSVFDVDL